MKTVNWYKVLFIFTLFILICYFISQCGNKKEGKEDYIWQDSLNFLKHEYSVKYDSMEAARINADLYHNKKLDSLTKIIDEYEPQTVIDYQDKLVKDSIVNSFSVNQLAEQITNRFRKR